ncbi:MAG TPA: L-histidine N(alpha)-methyltransferase [Bryobacteraceae bacterium]|nr:L-histidine N(alpha)-methyltransferase [Bryobacteraceae bacterium]
MNQFACEVRAGLANPQKELPSKYLYDDLGSALFEAITNLPEYGLTRADARLLHRLAPQLPRDFSIVAEFGSGAGLKTRPVLAGLAPKTYFPIDVSPAALERCRRELDGLAAIQPIEASYLDGLDCVNRRRGGCSTGRGSMLILFLGSSIGNFDSPCREVFLRQVRARMKSGDALLIGFDLVKDLDRMLDAYDDPTGVTAAFNLNLLGRINRALAADFDVRAFAHRAIYNSSERRIEMHLRSRVDQVVTVAEADFQAHFRADETIWTESSHKFDAAELPEIARANGYQPQAQWLDEQWSFAENLWLAP